MLVFPSLCHVSGFFLLQNLGADFPLKMSCCGKLFSVLPPASNHYLDYKTLKPLFDYAEIISAITTFLVKNELNSNDLKAFYI